MMTNMMYATLPFFFVHMPDGALPVLGLIQQTAQAFLNRLYRNTENNLSVVFHFLSSSSGNCFVIDKKYKEGGPC